MWEHVYGGKTGAWESLTQSLKKKSAGLFANLTAKNGAKKLSDLLAKWRKHDHDSYLPRTSRGKSDWGCYASRICARLQLITKAMQDQAKTDALAQKVCN